MNAGSRMKDIAVHNEYARTIINLLELRIYYNCVMTPDFHLCLNPSKFLLSNSSGGTTMSTIMNAEMGLGLKLDLLSKSRWDCLYVNNNRRYPSPYSNKFLACPV